MAFICLGCFPKRSVNFNYLRLLVRGCSEQKLLQSLPKKSLIKDAPIKFTTNKASSVKIVETTGLTKEKPFNRVGVQIVIGSLTAFLLYFCFIREENDIDEILKGNAVPSDDVQLLNLKLHLIYCQKNNLPTAHVLAKIRALEDKKYNQ